MHNFTKKVLVFCALCALSAGSAFSQTGFQEEKMYIGPSIGYVGFGGLGFGVGGEYAIDDHFGIGLDAFYSNFTLDLGAIGFGASKQYEYEYTLFGGIATASYHFSPKKKFDPFVKLGVGIFKWDAAFLIDGKEESSTSQFPAAYTTGLGYIGQLGARYHVSPTTSLRLAIGTPFLVSAGVDFAFGGPENVASSNETAKSEAAKKDTSAPANANRYAMYLGAYAGGKGAFNVNIPDGRKGGPGIGAEYGVMVYLPFGKKSPVGANIEIGMNSYNFVNKPNKDAIDTFTITEQYNYFTFAPSLNIGGFKLGVLFGFPTSASAKNKLGGSMAGSTITDSATEAIYRRNRKTFDEPYDPDMSEFLGTLVEARLGGMIPLLDDDTGRLDLHIQAGYVLTGLYDDFTKYSYTRYVDDKGNLKEDSGLNPQPVTFSIGLSYAFKIPFGK